MSKKVVILGGGTGTSTLVRGLKEFPVDITVIVSVSDDGKSTGRLRREFDIPAVGDLRKVIASMSETEPLIQELLEYRFDTTSDLNGHPVGNLLLAALCNITGNMSYGIKSLSKVLNLKGKVLPLTEDNVDLVGVMEDDSIIKGEHNITRSKKKIKDIYFDKTPKVPSEVIKSIKDADIIILSMGSLYTSIICNLAIKRITNAIDESNAKVMYVSNMFTQPGETDHFKVSDHIKELNKHLGKKKIDTVIANIGKIPKEFLKKYKNSESKDPVILDEKNIKGIKVIKDDFVTLDEGTLKHDATKVSFKIFGELLENTK